MTITDYLKTLPDPTESIVGITIQGNKALVVTQHHIFVVDAQGNLTELQVTPS